MTRRIKPYGPAYTRELVAMALAAYPSYPCIHCGHPVHAGYCCGNCGSDNPKGEA
jgi:hypothetical protein